MRLQKDEDSLKNFFIFSSLQDNHFLGQNRLDNSISSQKYFMRFWQRSDANNLAFEVIFNGLKPLVDTGNLFGMRNHFSIDFIQLLKISSSQFSTAHQMEFVAELINVS